MKISAKLLFLVLLALFLAGLGSSWWDNNWDYRKNINVSERSGQNLNDYQVRFQVDTESLISAGKMNESCMDVRFLDSDDSTKLDYWLVSGCNTSSTEFVVKLPSLNANSDEEIYMYYGNNEVLSTSSRANTMSAVTKNPGYEQTAACGERPSGFEWETGNDCWEVNTENSYEGSKSLGNDYDCDQVCSSDDEGTANYVDMWQNFYISDTEDYRITGSYRFMGIVFDGSGCSVAGGEDDSRLALYYYDSNDNQIASWIGPSFSKLGYQEDWTWHKYSDINKSVPSGTSRIKLEIQGGDNNNNCGSFTGAGNAGGFYDEVNFQVEKDVGTEPEIKLGQETIPNLCSRRGNRDQCILDESRSLQPNVFSITSVFRSERSTQVSSTSGLTSIGIENRSYISGTWIGDFNISSQKIVIQPGASFRPEENIRLD